MKICRDCKVNKPLEAFVKNKLCKEGIDTLCLSCNRQRVKKWRAEGRRDSAAEARRYVARHPEKAKARTARYQTRKKNACPEWLTDYQHSLIEKFYELATRKTSSTGISHHVDHIIPLQGKTVCGLHVPWNLQVLTAQENLSKHNRGY